MYRFKSKFHLIISFPHLEQYSRIEKNTMTFEVTDIVQLKSGGPNMPAPADE